MKRKVILFAALSSLLLSGCSRLEERTATTESKKMELTLKASFARDAKTRTTVNDRTGTVMWEPYDLISVFLGEQKSYFCSTNSEPDSVAFFEGEIEVEIGGGDGYFGGKELWGLYPYDDDATFSDGMVTTTLEYLQNGRTGTFAKGANITIAKSKNDVLSFYNVCGGVCFTLTRSDIKAVIFEGQNGETLSGKFRTTFEGGVPVVKEVVEGIGRVKLKAPGDSTFKAGKWYYLTALPTALNSGYKMTFYTDSLYAVRTSSDAVEISRGIYARINGADEGLTFQKAEPQMVDLGLSVKWATFNVGAISPEDYGDYYAWGETKTKSEYTWETYKYCNGTMNTLTKYNFNPEYGTVDNKFEMDASDDVASVRWGGEWRMPSSDEWNELRNNCTWEWISISGIDGYKVTSNVAGYTGNSIFIPAAGRIYYNGYWGANYMGNYWLSEITSYDPSGGMECDMRAEYYNVGGAYRCTGNSVRPVYGPRKEITPPAVNTVLHSASSYSAVVGGKITSTGGSQITSYGVVWSENENPTIELETKRYCNNLTDYDSLFFAYIREVNPGTKYYARPFAINPRGVSYGQQVSFTCSGQETKEYVDLGLSVKWATCNVGASAPEQYGDYYAWGETETKLSYWWDTYRYYNKSSGLLTKYNYDPEYGVVDSLFRLDESDDVASVKWGGEWRMPTTAELNELIEKCNWEWTSVSGINGFKVTSLVEGFTGNSIFIPAAGRSYDVEHGINYFGCYWTSELFVNPDSDPGYGAKLSIDQVSQGNCTNDNRWAGISVRPVYGGKSAPGAGETEKIDYERW